MPFVFKGETKVTRHEMDRFNLNGLRALRTFTVLHNHHLHLVPEHSDPPQKETPPPGAVTHRPPPPALTLSPPLPASLDWPGVAVSQNGNDAICRLGCLASFPENIACVSTSLLPTAQSYSTVCRDTSVVYPPIGGHSGCFSLLGTVTTAAVTACVSSHAHTCLPHTCRGPVPWGLLLDPVTLTPTNVGGRQTVPDR